MRDKSSSSVAKIKYKKLLEFNEEPRSRSKLSNNFFSGEAATVRASDGKARSKSGRRTIIHTDAGGEKQEKLDRDRARKKWF